jgi:hypothetical protein
MRKRCAFQDGAKIIEAKLVPRAGVEPAGPFGQQILSPVLTPASKRPALISQQADNSHCKEAI